MGLIKKFKKYVSGKRMVWPPLFREDYKLEDINFRDPYIVKDGKGGYVMVGTCYHYNYNDSNMCIMYKSRDLKTWSGPYKIIDGDKLGDKFYDFWAPEIHILQGRFLLAITLHKKGQKRGTYLFESKTLDGEYTMRGRITPCSKNSLDGTLVEQDGEIWCTYCHEYLDVKDGRVCTVKLNDSLDGIVESTDRDLFRASANTYKPCHTIQKVTDGPFYIDIDIADDEDISSDKASDNQCQSSCQNCSDNDRIDNAKPGEDKNSCDKESAAKSANNDINSCYNESTTKSQCVENIINLQEDIIQDIDSGQNDIDAKENTYSQDTQTIANPKRRYLLWSTFLSNGNYALLLAKSKNSKVTGEYVQDSVLYEQDGGHAMVFEDYDGKKKLVLHTPNARTIFSKKFEHPVILDFEQIMANRKKLL